MKPTTQVEYIVENNILRTITTTTEVKVTESAVNLDYLYNQLTTIDHRQKDFNAQCEADRQKALELIDECRKQGLKTQAELDEEVKPIEE